MSEQNNEIEVPLVAPSKKEIAKTAPRLIGDRLWYDFQRALDEHYNGLVRDLFDAKLFRSYETVCKEVVIEELGKLKWMPAPVRKRIIERACRYAFKEEILKTCWGLTDQKRIMREATKRSREDLQSGLHNTARNLRQGYREWFRENQGGKARMSDLLNDALPKLETAVQEVRKKHNVARKQKPATEGKNKKA